MTKVNFVTLAAAIRQEGRHQEMDFMDKLKVWDVRWTSECLAVTGAVPEAFLSIFGLRRPHGFRILPDPDADPGEIHGSSVRNPHFLKRIPSDPFRIPSDPSRIPCNFGHPFQ